MLKWGASLRNCHAEEPTDANAFATAWCDAWYLVLGAWLRRDFTVVWISPVYLVTT